MTFFSFHFLSRGLFLFVYFKLHKCYSMQIRTMAFHLRHVFNNNVRMLIINLTVFLFNVLKWSFISDAGVDCRLGSKQTNVRTATYGSLLYLNQNSPAQRARPFSYAPRCLHFDTVFWGVELVTNRLATPLCLFRGPHLSPPSSHLGNLFVVKYLTPEMSEVQIKFRFK